MVKAADALHEAGYRVRVVYASHIPSHFAMDELLLSTRAWKAQPVRYDRASRPVRRAFAATRQRVVARAAHFIGETRAPLSWVARGHAMAFDELVAAAASESADLYYGGTGLGLAATAFAAREQRAPYALDLEDFHSAEQDDSPHARISHAQVDRIERELMPGAAFLTTGSSAMADAYEELRGIRPTPINNVFPLRAEPPDLSSSAGSGLKLYWFSQSVGPGRGLEDAIRAAGIAGSAMELHLRGTPIAGYIESLQKLASGAAPALRVVHHPAAPPDPIDLCRAGHYDVGLALEQTHVLNRRICVTNKSFTYLASGLAVAFTDTPGQHDLALDLGEGAHLYEPGDVAGLASGLARWANDPARLRAAKAASWEAAKRRWHWEHPLERGALLELVARVIGPAGR